MLPPCPKGLGVRGVALLLFDSALPGPCGSGELVDGADPRTHVGPRFPKAQRAKAIARLLPLPGLDPNDYVYAQILFEPSAGGPPADGDGRGPVGGPVDPSARIPGLYPGCRVLPVVVLGRSFRQAILPFTCSVPGEVKVFKRQREENRIR